MLPASNITHQWESMGAFAGELSDDDLETLRADPRVESIEEDGIMKASVAATQFVPSPRPLCWILMFAELDQEQRPLGFKSNLFPNEAG